jgi:hypothetical protein
VWNHSTGTQLKRITPVAELDCYVMVTAYREDARADDLEIARAQLVATPSARRRRGMQCCHRFFDGKKLPECSAVT